MDTETKIVAAAVSQFKAHGFSGATTKAIAREAGVAEVTLFRYFGDKRSLFIRAANYIASDFGLKDLPNGYSGNFREDVIRTCRGLLNNLIQYNDLFRMLIFEAKKYEDIRLVMGEMRGRALGGMQKLIGRYTELGDEAEILPQVEWLGNSMMGASLSYCLFHANEDRETYVRGQAELIGNALVDSIENAGK